MVVRRLMTCGRGEVSAEVVGRKQRLQHQCQSKFELKVQVTDTGVDMERPFSLSLCNMEWVRMLKYLDCVGRPCWESRWIGTSTRSYLNTRKRWII